MKMLYAPWRGEYIRSRGKDDGCFICRAVKEPTEKNYVLYNGKYSIALMNLYPYNYGHILVAPKRHVASVEDLGEEEALEIFEVVRCYMKAARRILNPDGFNVGINEGAYAGASLPDHIHVHVVPRWKRDTAFMEVIAGTKVYSFSVEKSYHELREIFDEVASCLSQDKSKEKGQ